MSIRAFALFLTALLALPVAAQAADAPAATPDSLEIGYMPIIPDAQAFVVLENGTLTQLGIRHPQLVKFQNGPAVVQALLAGQLDVAYLGIGPAMVARARGADIKVVASSIVDQISIVALGDLAPYFGDSDPGTAFQRFAADHGRKPVIATFPEGSVPQTVLQYWLRRQLQIDPDSIEVVHQGAAQVQQSLMTGAVDGAAILEPVVTIVTGKRHDARVVAHGSELFPNQPGAVLVVRQRLIDQYPQFVSGLVAAHIAATRLLRDDPQATAAPVGKYVGGGRLPQAIVRQAIANSHDQFQADPNAIIESTIRMKDFQKSLGTLKVDPDLDTLFDTRFYDELKH